MTVAALAGLGLAGCAGSFVGETDAQSPVAPQIQALVDAHRTYPRWADFPTASTDLPAPMAFAARVNTLKVSGAALEGEAARIDWQIADPEAFAAEVGRNVIATPVAPESAQTLAEIEAFADRLRRRATAPPPVPRR